MKHLTFLLLFLCGALFNVSAQTLLPKPTKVEYGKGTCVLDPQLQIKYAADVPYTSAYLTQVLKDCTAPKGKAVVCIEKWNGAPTAEAYQLRITPDTLLLRVAHEDGLVRCAATLKQLCLPKGGFPVVEIEDIPTYSWRGVMLDVSRHFFTLDHIRKQIDIMAQFKLNTLHLHLTDAAGWRMEIKRYPRLTQEAAWRTHESWKTWWNGGREYMKEGQPGASGGYYTQDELRELVAYAQERGVTIIPEIEMPGHSEEVLAVYPELSCTHIPLKAADFCPGNLGTYEFLENVLLEVMDVFPAQYIHVGGDEAGKAAWPTCELCQKKAEEVGLEKVQQLQGYLIRHMNDFLLKHGRTLVGWDEVLADSLVPGTHIMNWRATTLAREAVQRGLKVILTPSAYCYFDYYQDAPPFQPEAIGGYLPLEQVYKNVSMDELNAEERKSVVGIQGNLWAEYIPTPEHAEYMLYPRALAIAEIGWNGEQRPAFKDFHKTALATVATLRQQGVNSFDLSQEIGLRKEYKEPVKHKAVGCKVQYNLPYSPYYTAGGDATLTDGLRGGWTYSDQRWQGFIKGDRFDVTVDLGKRQKIREVSTGFIEANGAEVWLPATYEIYVSDDNENFTEVGRQTFTIGRHDRKACQTYTWKGKAEGRYLRVKAHRSEHGGWIFADEIIVK
ncbi:MAG: family 20 glycosylhydrolase [Bacteroidaceae bacterium]|nr:family 20 glycosylhydrolase [Bacteroidaceae bacterium]